jgi:hypothetical protein
MVTSIHEYNLLNSESQVKIELALESCNNFQLSKPTSKLVKLNADCLELSENELLMMEYNFDFHKKFGDYEKHRLAAKRQKKNSIVIVNKEASQNSLKIKEEKNRIDKK